HAEKYLDAARQALGYAFADTRSRARFLTVEPSPTVTPEEAARKDLDQFLQRAFRRAPRPGEVDRYVALFQSAQKRGEDFDGAMRFALSGVLVSPHFLFRSEERNPDPEPRLVPDFAMASRLSYFLWGSMPDDGLLLLASEGKLQK